MNQSEFEEFSPQTIKQIGHYVYALIDPKRSENGGYGVFYIGKGQGQRCFAHAKCVKGSADFPKNNKEIDLKESTIEAIQKTGCDPDVKIVAHGLAGEQEALQIEAILIEILDLANKQAGHKSNDYWLTVNHLEERYGTPILRSELMGTVLLVGLNKSYLDAKDNPERLKEKTLGDWAVGPERRDKIDYVIGVFNGLMVSFYRTKKDACSRATNEETNKETRTKGQHRRFRWQGNYAPDLEARYMHRAIVSDDPNTEGETLTTLPRRAACRYLP